ncbi:MAG: cytochrome c oxidase subunit II, partial [Planctomycetes bacterium]|nr:cytochrome c oxidase subunit II [Planctomycetota bacterium]
LCWYAPDYHWWFPGDGQPHSTLGKRIDALFHWILIVVAVTFILTQAALGYVLWRGATIRDDEKALFSHGSHNLEVIWTIVPAGILLTIALSQLDVWAQFRIKGAIRDDQGRLVRPEPVAEVTARQFEWRIRYPAKGKPLNPRPQPDDIYTVNELHVPSGRPIEITLRTDDVQHAFFVPELRIKQDAVASLKIPVWFDALDNREYELLCAELCGWGHYKMKAKLVAQSDRDFDSWKDQVSGEQFDDGFLKPETDEK